MNDFIVTRSDESIEIAFRACLKNVDRTCDEIKKALTALELPGDAFPVQILLREALNNAVLHGCKGDLRKRVKCSTRWGDARGIVVTVEDEGDGFDWKTYVAREVDECACSGRGLAIMNTYGKKVSFSEKGNRVYMEIDPFQGGTEGNGHQKR
jgi:serine/threonine-protein kinase RsbW